MLRAAKGPGEYLFHLTHYENIPSLLKHGILSHREAYRQKLIKHDISSNVIQAIREKKVESV